MKTMQLKTFLALIVGLIDVTRAKLDGISTSTYDVIPERKTDAKYVGSTTIASYNRSTLTKLRCAGFCEALPGCGGFNFCEKGGRTCEAVEASPAPLDMSLLRSTVGCFYYHKAVSPCLNGGVMENSTCLCPRGYTNIYCEDHVQGCVDVYHQGSRDKKYGVVIQPHRNVSAFRVGCRLHEGPATRILKRQQGKRDFFKENLPMNVNHYKNGKFYPWNANGWIGLDKLHSILINTPYNYTAKVTVIFQNDTTEYIGNYGCFFVDSEENSYTLTYTNYWPGEYALDDGLSGSGQNDSANGQPFCPSSLESNCGVCFNSTISGGWFGTGCYYVNPLTVLDELVWPIASELLPVDTLYMDIIANIP